MGFEKYMKNVLLTDVAMLTHPASLAKTPAAAGIRGPVAGTRNQAADKIQSAYISR